MKIPALLLCLLPLPLAATTTTVSSISSLVSTVASANAGDTIYLADGTYSNPGTFTLSPSHAGTASNPITIAAADAGKVVFTGTTTMNIGASAATSPMSYLVISGFRFDGAINATSALQDVVAFNDAQNCRLTECAFINCGNLATAGGSAGTTVGTTAHIVGIYSGSEYLRFDHNYFKGGYSQSISFVINGKALGFTNSQSGPWHWIDHNAFVDIEPMAGNGQEPVQVGQSTLVNEMHVMVEWNLWDDASGDTEFFSFKTADNTARFNTFRDGLINYGTLSLRCGSDNTVDGNFVFSPALGINSFGSNQTITNNYIQDFINGFSGMTYGPINLAQGTSEAASTQAQPARRTLVANNTVVNFSGNTGGIVLGVANYSTGTIPEGTADVHAAQNVIINNVIQGGQGVMIDNLSSDTTTYGGDFTYNSGSASAGVTGTGITALTASPLYLDSTGVIPLYRLDNTAAVVGQGATTAGLVPPEDMDGQARTAADPGSDEYSAAALVRRPAVITDVGPAWMGRSAGSNLPPSNVVWGPSTLSATALSPTAVYLTWSGGSTTSGYQYRLHDADSPWSIPSAAFATGSATSATVTVSANQQYFFQVRALGTNADGSDGSAWSPVATVVSPLGYTSPSTGTAAGTVAVEAEDYTDLAAPANPSSTFTPWIFATTQSGYAGLGYLQASSQPASASWTDATGMDYTLYFPATGTYTAWARVYATDSASDTLRWGIGGTESSSSPVYITLYGYWTWVSLGTFAVSSSTAPVTLNLKRREPNLLLDRLYVTKNGDTPTGTGPSESDFLEAPLITSSSADAASALAVNVGSAISLTSAATANPTPSYQWETVTYGSSTTSPNEVSTAISGATAATYPIAAASSGNAGFYDVVVTNPAGSATSPVFNLGVVAAPTFVTEPMGGSIAAGSSSTLTATADLPGWTGSASWLFNGSAISGGSAVYPVSPGSGPTTLTYTIANATPANSGTYAVKLTDSAGTVTSTPVTVTVSDAGAPWQVNGSSLAIEAEAFTSTYAGDAGSYSPWSLGTTIAGYNGSGYMQASSQSAVPSWSDAPGLQYSVNFTATGAYTIWVRAYATDNSADSVYWGTNGTESNVVYTSTYNFWDWYSMGTWTIASGDVNVPQLLEIRRREWLDSIDRIYITKAGDTPSGNGPSTTARTAPTFTVQPSSVVAAVGQTPSTITFTAAANNASKYQWYRNGAAIAGATSATYVLGAPVADLPPYGRIAGSPNFGVQGTYTVIASNSEGSTRSSPAFLLIERVEDQANRGGIYPAAASVNSGQPILLSCTADAWNDGATATLIYPQIQWLKTGTAISGATGSSYYIPAAAPSDGATYSVVLTYTDPTTLVVASETISLVTLTVH